MIRFKKLRDGSWGVQCPAGSEPGQSVVVTRADASTTRVVLGDIVLRFEDGSVLMRIWRAPRGRRRDGARSRRAAPTTADARAVKSLGLASSAESDPLGEVKGGPFSEGPRPAASPSPTGHLTVHMASLLASAGAVACYAAQPTPGGIGHLIVGGVCVWCRLAFTPTTPTTPPVRPRRPRRAAARGVR